MLGPTYTYAFLIRSPLKKEKKKKEQKQRRKKKETDDKKKKKKIKQNKAKRKNLDVTPLGQSELQHYLRYFIKYV